jgi:hypothetical protein
MDIDAVRAIIRRNTVADEDGCWIWQKSLTVHGGYPQVYHHSLGPGPHRGNRVAFEAFKGWLAPGRVAAHHCDKPACMNPACLFAADQAGNLADMRAKGRGYRKLTDDQVRAIRAQWTGQRGQHAELAREYGVTDRAIKYIVDGEHYARLV